MLGNIIHPTDPQQTIQNASNSAAAIASLAGYALGLNGLDMKSLTTNGVPRWAIGVAALAAGAVAFARFAPESWIASIRMYGNRG